MLDCRWRIFPKCQYEASKALKKIQKQRAWDEGKGLALPPRPGKFQTVDEVASTFAAEHNLHDVEAVKEVVQSVTAIEEEQEANTAELIRRQGKMIVFGDSIQLQHVASGLFLTMSKLRGFEKSTRALEMTDRGSDHAIFRVQPAFRTYGQGEPIGSGDLVVFVSEKKVFGTTMLFHVSSTIGRDLALRDKLLDENQLSLSSDGRTGVEELFSSPADVKLTMFRLIIFQQWDPPEEQKAFVYGEDVVCLYHKDFESYLEYDDHGISQPVFTESQQTSEKARKKSYWMWKLERTSLVSGGQKLYAMAQQFRMKHLPSGMYLCVSDDKTVGMTSDVQDENTLFSFKPFSKEETVQPVKAGASVYLISRAHGWIIAEHSTMRPNDDEMAKRYRRRIAVRSLDQLPERDVLTLIRVNATIMSNVPKVENPLHVIRS